MHSEESVCPFVEINTPHELELHQNSEYQERFFVYLKGTRNLLGELICQNTPDMAPFTQEFIPNNNTDVKWKDSDQPMNI